MKDLTIFTLGFFAILLLGGTALIVLAITGMAKAVARLSEADPRLALPARTTSPTEATPPHTCILKLTPGVELFSPQALPAHESFAITITGVYSYRHPQYIPRGKADAFYDSGFSPNYLQPYHGLLVDGQPPSTPSLEDRATHCYTFSYRATGRKVSVLLSPPGRSTSSGTLSVAIAPFSAKVRALFQANTVAQLANEEAVHEHQRQEQIAEFEARLWPLAVRLDAFPHYQDPDFLSRQAAHYRDSLLKEREKILKGHMEFHQDPVFIAFLKDRRPDLYARATYQVRALSLAERLVVEPPAKPVLAALTPQEKEEKFRRYRERMLTGLRVQGEDLMAKRRQMRDLLDCYVAELDAYDLDPDERERLIRAFQDDLLHLGDGGNDDKGFRKY